MLADRHMRAQANLDRFLYTGNVLLGRTVGIIGCGNIGGRVAELCKGLFRMTVLAYDPYLTKEQLAAKGAEKVELKELMSRADYVTMHTPRNKETFGLVGYDQLALMKPTSYFINTSRGGTYVEEDLARILKEKKIAGAGIDVFLDEPPPLDHPLMAFDNVILTPHSAGATIESQDNVSIYSADQWLDIFDGKVPPRLVNKEAWPKYAERFERILGFMPAKLEG
jgi:D-3-phosphoglycerate dehydrogenase